MWYRKAAKHTGIFLAWHAELDLGLFVLYRLLKGTSFYKLERIRQVMGNIWHRGRIKVKKLNAKEMIGHKKLPNKSG